MTDIWFYITNFAVVTIEGVVLSRFGGRDRMRSSTEQGTEKKTVKEKVRARMASRRRRDRLNSKQMIALMWRCIGYIWVFGFFFWTVPKSSYPKIQCAAEAQYMQLLKALFKWEGTPS